jgi:hypothetical protein
MPTRRTALAGAICVWLAAAPQGLAGQSAGRRGHGGTGGQQPAPAPPPAPPRAQPAPPPRPPPAPNRAAPTPPLPSPAPRAGSAQQAEDEAIMRDLEFYMLLEMLKHYPMFYDDPEAAPKPR